MMSTCKLEVSIYELRVNDFGSSLPLFFVCILDLILHFSAYLEATPSLPFR